MGITPINLIYKYTKPILLTKNIFGINLLILNVKIIQIKLQIIAIINAVPTVIFAWSLSFFPNNLATITLLETFTDCNTKYIKSITVPIAPTDAIISEPNCDIINASVIVIKTPTIHSNPDGSAKSKYFFSLIISP